MCRSDRSGWLTRRRINNIFSINKNEPGIKRNPGSFLFEISDHTLFYQRKHPLSDQSSDDAFYDIPGKRLYAAGKDHGPDCDGIAVIKTVHEIKICCSEHIQYCDPGKTRNQHAFETRVFTFVGYGTCHPWTERKTDQKTEGGFQNISKSSSLCKYRNHGLPKSLVALWVTSRYCFVVQDATILAYQQIYFMIG